MPEDALSGRRAIRAAGISICSNTILLVSKLAVGILISSISVISEAIHSATDLLAALIARYSVKRSFRPPDGTHEFGHGKYESLSGAAEAILIFVAALIIIYEAGTRLISGAVIEFVEAGIVVMGLSAVANFFISRYLMRVARESESLALEADALHLRTDVWTSLGVFAGLVLIWFTGWVSIDAIMAIVVAAFIMNVAWKLTRRSATELLDHSLTAEEERVIEETIEEIVGGVATYHALRTRLAGRTRFVDFHLVVPRNMSVDRSHRLCDEIERVVKTKLRAANITIHVEPCNRECEECHKQEVCKDRM